MTSATNHNNEFDDELLSAYVDGEVTAEERAAVEARLGADPHAVQLVEELRSLSSALKALPRETIPRDLRAGVHAEIERANAAAEEISLPLAAPYERWQGIRRGLVWSAFAIAATLAMVVLNPEQTDRDKGDVAKVAKKNSDFDNKGVVGEDAAAERKVEKSELAADKSAAPPGLTGSMRALNAPGQAGQPSAGGGSMPASAPIDSRAAVESAHPVAHDSQAGDGSPRELDRADAPQLGIAGKAGAVPAPASAAPQGAVADTVAQNRASGAKIAAAPAMRSGGGALDFFGTKEALPTQIDLAVKQPQGVARFEQLLRRYDISLVEDSSSSVSDESHDRKLGDEQQKQAEHSEPQASETATVAAPAKEQTLNAESKVASDAKADAAGATAVIDSLAAGEPSEERVVVEASPAQINELYAACVADQDFFVETTPLGDQAKAQAGHEFAFGAAATQPAVSGGFGGGGGQTSGFDVNGNASSAESDARRVSGEPPAGARSASGARAWRLRSLSDGSIASARQKDSGDFKKSLAEEPKNGTGAHESAEKTAKPSGPSDEQSRRAPSSSESEQLAKQPQGAPSEKVRVVFVLRSLPTAPVAGPTASSAPTNAKPAPAAPAEPAPAKAEP